MGLVVVTADAAPVLFFFFFSSSGGGGLFDETRNRALLSLALLPVVVLGRLRFAARLVRVVAFTDEFGDAFHLFQLSSALLVGGGALLFFWSPFPSSS